MHFVNVRARYIVCRHDASVFQASKSFSIKCWGQMGVRVVCLVGSKCVVNFLVSHINILFRGYLRME